jgi:hypothetical protein
MWRNTISVKNRSLKVALSRKLRAMDPPEERQGVEPLRGGDGHELRQLIPDQPVATDATGKDEPEQDHTREPGKPSQPAQAAQDKFTGEMQP